MKKLLTPIALTSGLGILAAGSLHALPEQLTSQEQTRPATELVTAQRTAPLMRVGQLEGSKVYSSAERAEGETRPIELASIKSFELSLANGKIVRVMLSSGGVAGIGDTIRAIDFSRLSYDVEDGRFHLPLTLEQFTRIPEMDASKTTEASVRATEGPILMPAREPLAIGELIGTAVHADSREKGQRSKAWVKDDLVSWGKLTGLAIDPIKGHGLFALVEVGGVAGIGATTHPVPWTALQLNWLAEGEKRELLIGLPMSARELGAAPALDKENQLTLAHPAFLRTVGEFYGVGPDYGARTERTVDGQPRR